MERYQTLGKRIVAALIDTVFLLPLLIADAIFFEANLSPMLTLALEFSFSLLLVAYTVVLHWRFGRTLGKIAMKVKVVDVSERPISFAQALVRDIGQIVNSLLSLALTIYLVWSGYQPNSETGLILYQFLLIPTFVWFSIDFVVCVVSKKNRALHDLIAGTVVVRLDVPETPTDASKLEPPGPEHYDELRAA